MNTLLHAIGQVGKDLGKVILGSLFGIVSKDVPMQALPLGDVFLTTLQQIAATQLAGERLGLTGEQKRKFVAALAEQVILRSPIAQGKKLVDPTKFAADVENLVSACAEILHDFDGGAVETKDMR
jgi:hypothetical protein